MYIIQPFDETFDPNVHNKYLATRKKEGAALMEAETKKELKEMVKKMEKKLHWPKFSRSRFLIEAFIIGRN